MTARRITLALLLAGAARAQDAGPDAGLLDLGLQDPADAPAEAPDAGRPLGAIFDQAARAAARDRNRIGLAHTAEHRYPEALAAFREAHALDPTDPEITNNLGFLHHLLGNRVDAERYLRETLRLQPQRAVALDNLAELLAEDRAAPARLAEAADLLARLRLLRGNDPAIIRRQAQLAARRGQFDLARRYYEARLARAPADDALALELGDFYRALGEPDRALDWYRRVRADGELGDAARRIRELEIEREARRFGWVQPTGQPPPQARTLVERARAALGARRADEAARLFEEALALAPDFADAWHGLGDARAAQDDDSAAEIAWLRALVTDAGHADAARRLGELYRRRERWPDAALMFTRALTLRPDRAELHLEIARAWQAAGDLPRALRRVRLGLAALPEDAPDDALRALERRLTARLPAAPEPAPADADAQDPVGRAIARARAHFVRGEPDAAMAALRALPDAHRGARVHALEGEILLAAGRPDDAAHAFERALAEAPDPAVLARLGALRLEQGRLPEARAHLDAAAAAGDPDARLALIRLDLRPDPDLPLLADLAHLPALLAARDRLDALAADRPADDPLRADARALRAPLTARVNAALALLAGLLLALALPLALLARRRYGGLTLTELVDRHPDAGPDIQRVLSAIRHEVLKHNTMALGGLADALARREADLRTRAAWVRQSLLGPPHDAPAPGADPAITRLAAYTDQLRQIARAHAARLNPRRDPALTALHRGFTELCALAPALDRLAATGRAPRRLAPALTRAAHRLNIDGHNQIIALLDALRLLTVDVPLLRAIFDRTRREPAFAAVPIAPLALDAEPDALPARLAIPRAAFEDILQNLMRNAIQASARHAPGAEVVIGLAVDDEIDDVTFLARVRFKIRDRAAPLPPNRLRDRRIEDGLGLTADLVSRHEGSLAVEPEPPPWTKAVVLALPRVEADEEDGPWTN
ncbi:MAG: tetratricopeptide repeat protein [Myxococcales bacterium]|nr:tetratricopeptide repeat protein [Myxococcales bacterium]